MHMPVHRTLTPGKAVWAPSKCTRVQGTMAVHRRTNGTTGASATTNARSDVGSGGLSVKIRM